MEGKTPLFFAKDHRLIGLIAVADVIKEDSPKAVQKLHLAEVVLGKFLPWQSNLSPLALPE